ncbi:hypothetical protein DSAG12_02572 [Promethearchaeum syntrophicum]|uniref:DUF998 domain-containing protein n=1 Tax=Promethearchaeum syntrophicum TaxID=2594042 RepID=A0A5B9DC91_9ARCH|nr:hypothetical protein [Candidatus Prometheoarchaeum syntrophicum]QEE16742.1 hypothetical protein DSAG12_02572 [Candidatus Prometheoarchaeum syntrophicum]
MADQKIQTVLRLLVWLVAIVLILTIVLAWWQYTDDYNFFQDTISTLGGTTNLSGGENTISSMIFSIGLYTSGGIALIVAIIYFFKKDLFFHTGKAIIALFVAIGPIGVAIPRDNEDLLIFHAIGAAIFIGSFGILNGVMQLLRYSNKHRPKNKEEKKNFDFYLDLSMVYLTGIAILFYLIAFILHIAFSIELFGYGHALAQKIVVIISCVAVFFLDKDDM